MGRRCGVEGEIGCVVGFCWVGLWHLAGWYWVGFWHVTDALWFYPLVCSSVYKPTRIFFSKQTIPHINH